MTTSTWNDGSPALESPAAATANVWSPAGRTAMRIGFVYFVLINLFLQDSYIPGTLTVCDWLQSKWAILVQWVATTALGIHVDTVQNGSGDKTSNWVSLLCVALI